MDAVTATESACRQLGGGDTNKLRAKVVNILGRGEKVLEKVHNITRERRREALNGVRKDEKIMTLPADKGRGTVVMDKEHYLDKYQERLKDGKTYQKLKRDPISNYQHKFKEALSDLKVHVVITDKMHRDLFLTHFYGLPKVHKATMPLRPIVSSIDTIFYGVAKYLAKVLSPPVGKTEHHVQNSKDFVRDVREIRIEPDEELWSYDVSSLFTSVPVNKVLEVIREAGLIPDPEGQDTSCSR